MKNTLLGKLVDILEGRLGPDDLAALEAHLASCATCAREMAELGRMIDLMRTDTGMDPPTEQINHAVHIFDTAPLPVVTPAAEPDSVRSIWRRLVAVLRFDSGGFAPAMGVRAVGPVTRQMLFNAVSMMWTCA